MTHDEVNKYIAVVEVVARYVINGLMSTSPNSEARPQSRCFGSDCCPRISNTEHFQSLGRSAGCCPSSSKFASSSALQRRCGRGPQRAPRYAAVFILTGKALPQISLAGKALSSLLATFSSLMLPYSLHRNLELLSLPAKGFGAGVRWILDGRKR
jgi:hypothetical protein